MIQIERAKHDKTPIDGRLTSVRLPEQVLLDLADAAERLGTSRAHLIRLGAELVLSEIQRKV